MRHRIGQQRHIIPGHAGDGVGMEEIGAIAQPAPQARGVLLHSQGDVELHRARFQGQGLEAHLAGLQLAGQVLQGEKRLKEGRISQRAPGLHCLHQILEGDGLALEGGLICIPFPGQEFEESGIAGEIGAQRQRVDEVAQQRLQFGEGTVGHRRADDNIILTGVTGQQRLEPGQKDVEQGGVLLPGQSLQLTHQRFGDEEFVVQALDALHIGPGIIGVKLQGPRQRRHLLPPEGKLTAIGVALDPGPLPGRVIGILDGKIGQVGLLACDQGLIDADKLFYQHAHAPPVHDDVVHGEQEDVFMRPHAQQSGPHQRRPAQIEAGVRQIVGDAPELAMLLFIRALPQVVEGDIQPGLPGYLLAGASFGRVKPGPQHLVPGHEPPETLLQQRRRQRPHDAQCRMDVIGGIPRLQLIDEPELLLLQGKREIVPMGAGRDGQLQRLLPVFFCSQQLCQLCALSRRKLIKAIGHSYSSPSSRNNSSSERSSISPKSSS